jgi:hypothetical protein
MFSCNWTFSKALVFPVGTKFHFKNYPQVNCQYSAAVFSTNERKRRPRGDRKSLEMTIHLKQTFEAVIKTDLYPRCVFHIDFYRFLSIFIDFYRFLSIFIDFYRFLSIFIDFFNELKKIYA